MQLEAPSLLPEAESAMVGLSASATANAHMQEAEAQCPGFLHDPSAETDQVR